MKEQNSYKLHSQLALPFSETNRNFIKEIFKTLELKFGLIKNSNQKLIDLGAGNGQIVIYAALNYGIKSVGIEIDPNLIIETKERIYTLKKDLKFKKKLLRKIKVKQGDLFEQNLEQFDYIYVFSLPTMHKYLDHVFRTAKKDSIIVSHKYPLVSFNSYLKLIYKLDHEIENQKIPTFIYCKF